MLNKNLSLVDEGKLVVYPFGVGDKEGTVKYDDVTSSSKMADDGAMETRVVRIDDILGNEPVSFIKMDIEGMEIEALRGAEKTISCRKPRLAICVYHRLSDLWEIPLLIKSYNDSYSLYMRHHTPQYLETVLYCI